MGPAVLAKELQECVILQSAWVVILTTPGSYQHRPMPSYFLSLPLVFIVIFTNIPHSNCLSFTNVQSVCQYSQLWELYPSKLNSACINFQEI